MSATNKVVAAFGMTHTPGLGDKVVAAFGMTHTPGVGHEKPS